MACLTEQACQARATVLGLQLGGGGYAFAGEYGDQWSKGCYAYDSSSTTYAGMAFFGRCGGAACATAQMTTALDAPKYRLNCLTLSAEGGSCADACGETACAAAEALDQSTWALTTNNALIAAATALGENCNAGAGAWAGNAYVDPASATVSGCIRSSDASSWTFSCAETRSGALYFCPCHPSDDAGDATAQCPQAWNTPPCCGNDSRCASEGAASEAACAAALQGGCTWVTSDPSPSPPSPLPPSSPTENVATAEAGVVDGGGDAGEVWTMVLRQDAIAALFPSANAFSPTVGDAPTDALYLRLPADPVLSNASGAYTMRITCATRKPPPPRPRPRAPGRGPHAVSILAPPRPGTAGTRWRRAWWAWARLSCSPPPSSSAPGS